VFWCHLRRNHANRQIKTSWRLVKILGRPWMKIQEAPKDMTKGEVLFPSPKISYIPGNTQKTKKQTFTRKKYTLMWLGHIHAPWGVSHAPRAWQNTPMHLRHARSGSKLLFPLFKWKKPSFSAQTLVETKPMNKTPLVHNFSFRMKQFKRKASTMIFKGWVSPHSKSLGYISLH
jgi:hypothetical protein